MPTIRKIGVLTGGGDAPGLNAVIRAVVKTATNANVTVMGTFDYADRVMEMFQQMHLDALICIGGDGTLGISYEFYRKGIPLVGVPKTIDNDIVGTTSCFGFDTAVSFATEAID